MRARVLAVVLLVLAGGVSAVAFGPLSIVMIGCVFSGIGLAAWMLPVTLLNRDGSARIVAWRTALYRVGMDAGVFLGPVLSGLLAQNAMVWVIGVATSAALVAVSIALLRVRT